MLLLFLGWMVLRHWFPVKFFHFWIVNLLATNILSYMLKFCRSQGYTCHCLRYLWKVCEYKKDKQIEIKHISCYPTAVAMTYCCHGLNFSKSPEKRLCTLFWVPPDYEAETDVLSHQHFGWYSVWLFFLVYVLNYLFMLYNSTDLL